MRRTTFITALIACLALAVAIAPAASAKGGGTQRTISLKGSVSFPNATGKAVSKVNGNERELEVDVQHIRSLAGKRVNVNVNGHLIATPLVNSLGHSHRERDLLIHANRVGRGRAGPPFSAR